MFDDEKTDAPADGGDAPKEEAAPEGGDDKPAEGGGDK